MAFADAGRSEDGDGGTPNLLDGGEPLEELVRDAPNVQARCAILTLENPSVVQA
jgi:hypothetical protein